MRNLGSLITLAADMALLSFLAAMTAAPLFCTVGTNSVSSQLWSTATAAPLQVAWLASGNCVLEWLPQMVTLLMAEMGWSSLAASWAAARFWSSLIVIVRVKINDLLAVI